MRRHRYNKPPPGRTIRWGHPYAHGLKLFVPMSEFDGVLCNDLSPVRNNATMIGGASWSGGVVNLDGTDGEITMRRVPNLGDWTVHIRCSPDDVTSIARTWLDQGDILIKQVNDGVVYGATDILEIDYTSTVASALTAGEIADIFVTRAGDTITAFVYDSTGALTTDSFTATGTPKSDATSLVIGAPSRTALAFVDLTPTDLAAAGEKALLITAADDIQFPRGSAPLTPGVNYENLNGNQMTIGIWIESLNFVPGDGMLHYFMDNIGTNVARNRITFLFTTTGLLRFFVYDDDSTSHYVQFDATSWAIGESHQIVAIIDFKNDYIALFVDGGLEDDVPTGALASDSIDVIESVIHFSSDSIAANQLNGAVTLQIWDMVQDATWVTAQWNSGDGLPFVVDADTILLARFSEDNTGIVYHHGGQIGTATTTTSFTATDDVGSRWTNNDAVIVQGGCGDSVFAVVNGAASGFNVPLDNGGGGGVTGLDLVGVHADLNGSSESFRATDASFPSAGITGATDFTIIATIKPVSISAGTFELVTKYATGGNRRMYRLFQSGNDLGVSISSDGTSGGAVTKVTSANILIAGVWQHVAIVYDASAGTVDFYYNGYFYEQETALPNTIADKTPDFTIGVNGDGTLYYAGGLFNVALFDDKRTPSQILASATNPLEDLSGAGNIIGQWYFNEAAGATVIDNNESTAGGDLVLVGGTTTNFGTHTREQTAHISLNLLITDENGGIGGHTPGDAASVISKSTTEIFKDSQSLKVLNGDGTQAFDRFTVTTVTGEDYWFHGRFFAPDTPDGASRLVDVDGVAALGITVTLAGLSAGWNTVEFCFEAQDTSTTIDLGSGSVTNAEFGYWDDVELFVNMINKPGMEGGADPPAGWTQETDATVISDTSPHSGTNCLKVTAAAANVGASQNVTLMDATNYTFAVWAKATSGDTAALVVDKGDGTIVTLATTTSTSWTLLQGTFLSTGVSGVIYLRGVVNGDIVWFDDASGLKNDTAPATVASRIRDFAGGNVDGIRIHDRALSQNDIEAIRRQPYGMIR